MPKENDVSFYLFFVRFSRFRFRQTSDERLRKLTYIFILDYSRRFCRNFSVHRAYRKKVPIIYIAIITRKKKDGKREREIVSQLFAGVARNSMKLLFSKQAILRMGSWTRVQKRRELGIWTGTSDNRIGGIIPVVAGLCDERKRASFKHYSGTRARGERGCNSKVGRVARRASRRQPRDFHSENSPRIFAAAAAVRITL